MEKKHWLIAYLPATLNSKEVGWVYYGTKEELDKYLFENRSCQCPDCSRYDNWWNSAEACEYSVTELDVDQFWDFVNKIEVQVTDRRYIGQMAER